MGALARIVFFVLVKYIYRITNIKKVPKQTCLIILLIDAHFKQAVYLSTDR
jgi:hypothetical protein